MRIAIDATAIPPLRSGAGNYIFYLVQHLSHIDHENTYFIFAKPNHIDELGIDQPNFHFVPIKHAAKGTRLVWEQIGLPWHLKRLGIDLLHSPHYTAPLLKVCKLVVTFHDMTFQLMPEAHGLLKRVFFPMIMHWSARFADKLIAASESTRKDVIRLLGVAPGKIVPIMVAANPVFGVLPRVQVEQACARYNLLPNGYILYVGVLEPRKNVPLLIEAYASLAREFPHVPLVIVGKKGWMYDEIFERVTVLGLQDRVRFLGHIPRPDLIALYNGARVVVYPSRYEGFGVPVLEAMQCGTPVITTNVSSIPEVAGDAALMIDPDDVQGLGTALRRTLTDDALARDLAERGLARAARFSWQRCAEETLAVYRSVGQLSPKRSFQF